MKTDFNNDKKQTIVLVGNPNVGKSVLFSLLSGRYTVVSNFPGTTVEYEVGEVKIGDTSYRLIDTPGVNSLIPMSEDEQVTRNLILNENIYAVVVVGDGKNIKRTLSLVIQILEMNLPVVVVLNMMDEALQRGIKLDTEELSNLLSIPVVETIAVRRKGIDKLFQALEHVNQADISIKYGNYIENAIGELLPVLPEMIISRRAIALMLLSGDITLVMALENTTNNKSIQSIEEICVKYQREAEKDIYEHIQLCRLEKTEEIQKKVIKTEATKRKDSFLESVTMHRIWGYVILLFVLAMMYLFIGKFGAQIGVGFIEEIIFNKYINPWLINVFDKYIGANIFSEFFIGQYGLITMALTYGLAIILPIVLTFFIGLGVLEDSGYLPRLSILLNKFFKAMGLNGKAVIPMILGLGCDTMATMTTRIMNTRKERILVTFLLALGIPCSAQLSIIFAMVARMSVSAFLIWFFVVCIVLITVGYLAAKVIPGESSDFILEVPPLRIPLFSNIIIKTFARLEWYLKEVIPLFMLSTAILFSIHKIGLLVVIEKATAPLIVSFLSLPPEATGSFLMGFLRRDYAAAGLFSLFINGNMDTTGAIISMVTMTLFVPCFANTLMIIKERGFWMGVKIVVIVFTLSILVGGILNLILRSF